MYVRLFTAFLLSTSVQSQSSPAHHLFAAPPQQFRQGGGYEHSGAFASDAMRDQIVFGFRDYPVYDGETGQENERRYGGDSDRDGRIRRHGQESDRRNDGDRDGGIRRHRQESDRRYGWGSDMDGGVRRHGQESDGRYGGDSNTDGSIRRHGQKSDRRYDEDSDRDGGDRRHGHESDRTYGGDSDKDGTIIRHGQESDRRYDGDSDKDGTIIRHGQESDRRYDGDSDRDGGVRRHGHESDRGYGGDSDRDGGVRRHGHKSDRRYGGDIDTDMGVIRYGLSEDEEMKMKNNRIGMSKHKEYKDYENELKSYNNKHDYRAAKPQKLKETPPNIIHSRAAQYHNENTVHMKHRRDQKQRERRQEVKESERKDIPNPSDYGYDNEDYYDYEYYDTPVIDPKPTEQYRKMTPHTKRIIQKQSSTPLQQNMTSHQHYEDNILQGGVKQRGNRDQHKKGQLGRGKGIKDLKSMGDSSKHRNGDDGDHRYNSYHPQQMKPKQSYKKNARARVDKENMVRVADGQFKTRMHRPLATMAMQDVTDEEYHERKYRDNPVTYQQYRQEGILKTEKDKRLSKEHYKAKTKTKEPGIDRMFHQLPGQTEQSKISARSAQDYLEGESHHPRYTPYPPPRPSYDGRQVRQVEQNGLQAAVVAGAAGYNAAGYNEPQRLSFQIHGQEGPNSYRFGHDTGLGYNRQFRYEERDNYGLVKGRYGYYDQEGELRVVNYSAHPITGYHVDV